MSRSAAFLVSLAATTHAAAPARAPPRFAAPVASVWPAPQSLNLGTTSVVLDASFLIACASASMCPDPLPAAIARYDSVLFFAGPPATNLTASITGLTMNVASDAPLTLGVSENYTLTVPVSGIAEATCVTQWGCLRALETFSQLFTWAGNGVPTTYSLTAAPVTVSDYPRWSWRGVLIDSSRHFLEPAAVKVSRYCIARLEVSTRTTGAAHWNAFSSQITLDAMSYNKLNTCVHVTIAQPKLTRAIQTVLLRHHISPSTLHTQASLALAR